MLVEIFCEVDDFCKFLEKEEKTNLIEATKKAGRKPELTPSEIMTISIHYHTMNITSFKAYYNMIIRGYERSCFKHHVSYGRFIELRQEIIGLLLLFLQMRGLGKCDGVSIIDSTTLEVCDVRRESSHKLFKGIARKGKTSTGWFFGFKLHCIINSQGEIISFFITPGNVSDKNISLIDRITKNIFGKLVADRGYIGRFMQLYEKGITLIHGINKNMKNKLMLPIDKWLLSKRGIIESVFGILKEWCVLESSKNRSRVAYLSQIFSALAAYCFRPKKPQIVPLLNVDPIMLP